PATTVLDLTTSRKRYVAGALVASVVCSVGSAMGVEAYAQTMGAPTGLGYAAEVAMTGLSTYAIAWRGGLARGRAVLEGIPTWALPVLIVVPLLASIAGSTAGSGPVGAVCSIGAAAFAWFAYLVSSTGADAIAQAVDRMDRQAATVTVTEVPADNEDQGEEHVPAGPAPLPRRSDRRDALTVVGDALADEASEYLRGRDADRGDDTSAAADVPPGDDGVTSDVPPSEEADDDTADQARPTPLRRPRKRPGESLEDAARRRAAEAERRVRGYFEAHPDAAVKEAARDLRMDPKTVRKYRPGAEGSAA
ncbi:MAG: hypothetical protein M0026_01915, partial [Nocardiopsaceae bacterium]|nr:hypothetical protein [Nocardiopsaceae bacterium]